MVRYLRRRGFRRGMRRRSYKNKYISRHRTGRGLVPPPELKCYDPMIAQTVTFVAAGSTGTINQPQIGAGFFNRIGNRISMKTIELNIYWVPTGATTSPFAGEIYRIALVYDSQINGANPAITDIFSDVDISGNLVSGVTARPNMNNRDRFLILKDKIFTTFQENSSGGVTGAQAVPSTLMSALQPPFRNMKWYIKLRGLETIFKGNTGTVGDIATGGLAFVTQCSVANPSLSVVVTARLRWYD